MYLIKARNTKHIKIIYSSCEIAAVFIFMHFLNSQSLKYTVNMCVSIKYLLS